MVYFRILLYIIVSIGLSIVIYLIISKFGKGFFHKFDKGYDDYLQIKNKLKKPLLFLISNIIFLTMFYIYQIDLEIISLIKQFLVITMIFIIAWLLIRIAGLSKFFILRSFQMNDKNNLTARKMHTQFNIIQRIINGLIIFLSLGIALMTFDSIKRVGISLFASAGIAGIIIGFAAQKIITTFLAGIQIAITQPIRLDDVVIVEGEWGWIEEINLTYVVVRIWDKRRLIVPTTYFIENTFENWTRISSDILGTIYIYTDYSIPVEELRNELSRLLKLSEYWNNEVNVLQMTDVNNNTIELRALVSANNSPDMWELRVFIREKLIEFIKIIILKAFRKLVLK